MTRVLLPPLLLLLLFIAFSPGGVLSQDGDCNAADVVLEEGQIQVIDSTEMKEHAISVILNLFMMPESGFKGVRLYVHGREGTQNSVWIPAESECWPRDDTWYQVRAVAAIGIYSRRLYFDFASGGCLRDCITTVTVPHGLYRLSVVAYGPSRWRKNTLSSHCDITTVDKSPPIPTHLPNCSTPPTSDTTMLFTQTPTTTTTPTIQTSTWMISAVFLVVVVMLNVVTVVMVCWKRKTRTSHEARFPSQTAHPAPLPAHPAPLPAHPTPLPAHPAPRPAHPAPKPQFTSGRGHAAQDTDSHIYEVIAQYEVPRLHDTESRTNDNVPVYHDVAAPAQPHPESPSYQNVSLYDDVAAPSGSPQDPRGSESDLYLTVL